MTQTGELLTQKGDIYESVFHTKRHSVISYLKYAGKIQDFSFPHEEKNINISYKMVFILKGEISCIALGSDAPYITLNNQQHNLISVSADTRLSASNDEDEVELIVINLGPSFLNSYLPVNHPYVNCLHRANDYTARRFSAQNLFITPEISAILSSIENTAHKGFCMELFLESKVIELLVLQLAQLEQLEQNSTDEIPSKLKKEEMDKMNEVREILISNSNSQLPLRTLAHMVGTNEFNLKKHFKLAFGTTVYGYLNQYKMEEAKKMLMTGDHNVSEISGKMGYKHPTHFTNAFKKYFGYLPTKLKMSLLLMDPEFCLFLFSA